MTPATFRHTVIYHGPRATLAAIRDAFTTGTVDAGDGVTRTASLSKLRNLAPPPSTPKQVAARSVNWLHFQIAGAVGHLSFAVANGVRLPSAQDDADLREALALLAGIDRRRRDRKEPPPTPNSNP